MFIRDWPKIRKSKIPLSEFCSISRDRGELGIPNSVGMSLMRSYLILQNARFIVFTIFELRENQQRVGSKNTVKKNLKKKMPVSIPNFLVFNLIDLRSMFYLSLYEHYTFQYKISWSCIFVKSIYSRDDNNNSFDKPHFN